VFIALGGWATPAVMINGRYIRNGTISDAKIHDGTLTANKFRDGQLPTGPRGLQGLQGPHGPQGNRAPPARTARRTWSCGRTTSGCRPPAFNAGGDATCQSGERATGGGVGFTDSGNVNDRVEYWRPWSTSPVSTPSRTTAPRRTRGRASW
jgi:hypothetical protein